MKLLRSASAIHVAFDQLIKKYQSISLAVAWASHEFPAYKTLVAYQSKIKQAIVGTHFYQTHPDFIAHFRTDKRVRFIKQTAGVFHPKLYLFENGGSDWACILGSPNFTNAAFSRNDELATMFSGEDDKDGDLKLQLMTSIKEYWPRGGHFKKAELASYRIMARRAREKLKPIAGDFGDDKQSVSILESDLVNWSWPEFMAKVHKKRGHEDLAGRLRVLARAQEIFDSKIHFSAMALEERRSIAGYSSDREIDWGWFGSMWGAGRFKTLVTANDRNLSRALDSVPPRGAVLKQHYLRFVDHYLRAYPNGKGHGLATATRLLAMKRPDAFVCFDSANRKGLCDGLNISVPNQNYEKYWDAIIARFQLSNWWNAPRPTGGAEMAVWDGRTAFLDSIFYTGTGPK